MHHILKSHHPVRHVKSFKYAFEGVFHALLNEGNFRVQVVIATVATYLGFYFNIDHTEWALLVLSMGFLLSAELINTVVEEVIDNLITEQHLGAKIIKDVSAGYVLISAITSLLILILIFGHHFVK